MKVKAIIIAAVAAAAAFGMFWALPRSVMENEAEDNFSAIDTVFGTYSMYELKNEDTTEYSNSFFSMELPARYIEIDSGAGDGFPMYMTADEDTSQACYIVPDSHADHEKVDLVEGFGNDPDIDKEGMRKDFEEICGYVPDSRYEAYKCMILLDIGKLDFPDYEKSNLINALLETRNAFFADHDKVYIYEKDGVNGVLTIKREYSEALDRIHTKGDFTFFTEDDPDTSYRIVITDPDEEDIFKIINTVRFKQ